MGVEGFDPLTCSRLWPQIKEEAAAGQKGSSQPGCAGRTRLVNKSLETRATWFDDSGCNSKVIHDGSDEGWLQVQVTAGERIIYLCNKRQMSSTHLIHILLKMLVHVLNIIILKLCPHLRLKGQPWVWAIFPPRFLDWILWEISICSSVHWEPWARLRWSETKWIH